MHKAIQKFTETKIILINNLVDSQLIHSRNTDLQFDNFDEIHPKPLSPKSADPCDTTTTIPKPVDSELIPYVPETAVSYSSVDVEAKSIKSNLFFSYQRYLE